MKQDRPKENEDKYCGECCWFYAEDTDGWGLCGKQILCDSMNCSDLCTNGTFISREHMRHYQAVLLQANRYRRDDHVPSIYRMPDPKELGKAIDFAYEFIRIFSKL